MDFKMLADFPTSGSGDSLNFEEKNNLPHKFSCKFKLKSDRKKVFKIGEIEMLKENFGSNYL